MRHGDGRDFAPMAQTGTVPLATDRACGTLSPTTTTGATASAGTSGIASWLSPPLCRCSGTSAASGSWTWVVGPGSWPDASWEQGARIVGADGSAAFLDRARRRPGGERIEWAPKWPSSTACSKSARSSMHHLRSGLPQGPGGGPSDPRGERNPPGPDVAEEHRFRVAGDLRFPHLAEPACRLWGHPANLPARTPHRGAVVQW